MSGLPSPSTLLGVPKYDAWYPGQEDLFRQSLDWYYSPARFLGLSVPTGSGKSLSAALLCVYSGARSVILTATKGLQSQYCVSPSTRVLTADMRYIEAGCVGVGDRLAGFDEGTPPASGHRKWRVAVVESVSRVRQPSYALFFVDGTRVVCSADHRWLVVGGRSHGKSRFWRSTSSLRIGGRYASKVARFVDVWPEGRDYESGYLAAAFDGEGHLRQGVAVRAGGMDVSLGFSQNENGMLAVVRAMLAKKGFSYSCSEHGLRDACVRLGISGRAEILRFLGHVRPRRLLDKFDLDKMGSVFTKSEIEVLHREFLGESELVAIKTSTGTYIAEGLASHNCGDVAPLGGAIVVGQNNFPCPLVPGLRADEGPCHDGLPCPIRESCPYRVQLAKALQSKLVVTNYAYWLAQTNFASGLGDVGLIVCDEAHLAFSAMESYLTIFLSRLDIEPMGVHFPESADQWGAWRSWAEVSLPTVDEFAAQLEADIKSHRSQGQPVPNHLSRVYRSAKGVAARVERLSSVGEDWVIQRTLHGYRFVPKWVANYSSHLFHDVPKVVLMSAILSHKAADCLGVPSDGNRAWVEADSHFPPANTPIWHVPTARIDHRMDDFGSTIWVSRIDQIIQRRLDRKGIVFTVSYERARLLLQRSRFKHLMLSHSTGDVVQVVARFKAMRPPAVLVSPTVTTGWDFPASETNCSYLVVGKIPFPDTREPVTKARAEEDKDWTSYIAMDTLVQECGRATRSVDDRVEVLIIDDNARWFMFRCAQFAPKWFLGRWRGSLDSVPDPLV